MEWQSSVLFLLKDNRNAGTGQQQPLQLSSSLLSTPTFLPIRTFGWEDTKDKANYIDTLLLNQMP